MVRKQVMTHLKIKSKEPGMSQVVLIHSIEDLLMESSGTSERLYIFKFWLPKHIVNCCSETKTQSFVSPPFLAGG